MKYKPRNRTRDRQHPADPNLLWCPKCKEYKSKEIYSKNKSTPDGYGSLCKKHERERRAAERRNLPPKEWKSMKRQHPTDPNKIWCIKCKTYKTRASFSRDKKSKIGYRADCIECYRAKNRERKSKLPITKKVIIRTKQTEWRLKNKAILRIKQNKRVANHIANISDSYVAQKLKRIGAEVFPETIELKRQGIILKRNIKKLKEVCNGFNISQNQRV